MKKVPFIIFDFDCTFIKCESFEVLAEIALMNKSNKEEIISKILKLTDDAMEGKFDYSHALKFKLDLFEINKSLILETIEDLKLKISESFIKNKKFIENYKDKIFIISGGFKEIIVPIVESFGFSSERVFANEFIFDKFGNVIGINEDNPLSESNGKGKVIEKLNLGSEVVILGDGYNDYEAKLSKKVKYFYAFIENISRNEVIKNADYIISNLDEFIDKILYN